MTTRRDEDPATGLPDHTQPAPGEAADHSPQSLPATPGTTRAERRRAQEAAEAAAGRPFSEAFTESPSGTRWLRPTFDEPEGAGDRPGPAPAGELQRRDPGTGGDRPGPAPAGELPRRGPGTDGDRPGPAPRGELPRREPEIGGDRPGPDPAAARGRRERGPGDPPPGLVPERRNWQEPMPGGPRSGGFDPGDTGTWRVRDVVPGADGGRRNTVILRYLLGLLAVDHVRSLGRWAFALPPVGLVLLLVRPRWIGLAVIVLGVLLVVARFAAVRLISRRTLPRRYRPVEDELRAAVEAGKANLRGELSRVGMPSSALGLTRSVVQLGTSDSRRSARARLRDIDIDRVLPRAQLDRALRVLDEAPAPR